MTRHRTFLARGSTAQCAVCEVGIGAGGSGRARVDIIGQMLCSKHGQAARRFTQRCLLQCSPRLFALFRIRKDLTFLRTMLDPGLLAQLVRYPPSGRLANANTLPSLLPYHRVGGRARHRRRRKAEPNRTSCGLCSRTLCGEERGECRPWADQFACRACHARAARQDDRAVAQFDALVAYVRNDGNWLLSLVHPSLRRRVVRHRARLRPAPVALEPDKLV